MNVLTKYRWSSYLFLGLLCASGQSIAESLSGSRPNIIVVMTDDQGYGDLSCNGHPYIKTPHIDKLREQSTRFEDFHVSSSCAPTRAAIMSGVHPFKVGVTHTIFSRELMALDQKILPQIMGEAGYATGLFGKWHLGDEDPYQPHMRGFDESLIHGGGIAGASGIRTNGSYTDMLIRHNGQFVQTHGFCTDVFFGQAMNWMKAQHDAKKPFLACIFPNAPHGPWSAPEKYIKLYDTIEDPSDAQKAGFFAMISNIDDNVGLLMEKLEQWGMEEDTLLIFMTDNGSVASSVYNAGMNGGKTSVHEGGSRVPFFIRLPGKIEAGRDIDTMARHFDLLPTFADLAGVDTRTLQTDGKSLLPLLEDPNAQWEKRMMFFHKGRWGNPDSKHAKHRRNPGADNNKFLSFAARDEQWRLTVNKGIDKDLELFDITEDPGEKNDVAKEHPEIVSTMMEAYGAWWDVCRPLMINEDADITVSAIYWPTYLREQKKHGGVPDLFIPGVQLDLQVVPIGSKAKTKTAASSAKH
ncbi:MULTISPECIES: arylsulfatase [unclassified Lentimonas]|uniref:arylsulfatase n=1 Tax=unclassified Lentimonas TaxID=2630993 RepID=UPI001328FD89|nr:MULTISPECIES: arylsulfatase [unclassified Lentimonas]CAA6692160.1 Choline-sulfatase (EC [Lentimonas sp. CC10]CAA6696449.1 Choline-sulfatase (EC [Lentimonas sp. CC19]CAA7071878.1 Choline-sulfatase (EC [Lentimonas sp. CC11]